MYKNFVFLLILFPAISFSQKKPNLKETIEWLNSYGNEILTSVVPHKEGSLRYARINVTKDSIIIFKQMIIHRHEYDVLDVYRLNASRLDNISIWGESMLAVTFKSNIIPYRQFKGENARVELSPTSVVTILIDQQKGKEDIERLIKALNHYAELSGQNTISKNIFD